MTSWTREDAQRRIEQIRQFNRELDALRLEQVPTLTAMQREDIRVHHERVIAELAERFDADVDERGRQLSLTMRIFSVTAAILLSATVFLVFYHFWASIALTTQIVLLIAAPLTTFGITVVMKERDPTGYFSRLAAALCFACFVLNVVILPTLLNLSVGALPVLVCGAFAFVLAYGVNSALLLCAGAIGVFVYSAALIAEAQGSPWWTFAQQPENFLVGALIVSALSAVRRPVRSDFPTYYRVFGCIGLFVPLLLVSGSPASGYWPSSANAGLYYQGVTLIVSVAAIYLGLVRGWPEVTLLGVFAVLGLLTERVWIWILPRLPVYEVFLVASGVAVAALCALAYVRAQRRPVSEPG